MAKAVNEIETPNISGMSLRCPNWKEVKRGFLKIADEECRGRQVWAFEKIVMEAIEKRNGKK